MAAWRYKISPLVLKIFHSFAVLTGGIFFQHSKRNFISLRGHVMSSVSFLQSYYMLWAEF